LIFSVNIQLLLLMVVLVPSVFRYCWWH